MLPVTNGRTACIGSIASASNLIAVAGLNALLWVLDAARFPQFRVAGKRRLSGLRTVVRNGDGRRRSIRCTIHLLPGLWRASGELVGVGRRERISQLDLCRGVLVCNG